MKQIEPNPKKTYRTRGVAGVTLSVYVPKDVARAIQFAAERDYGGNQSALITEALSAYLGTEVQKNSEPELAL